METALHTTWRSARGLQLQRTASVHHPARQRATCLSQGRPAAQTSPPQGEPTSPMLRAPRHSYGGPEPFGTGAGILRWEREAGALLYDHLRAEREKDWKRLRHLLVLRGPTPEQQQQLGAERLAEIDRTRLKVRFRKFWDLMNEKDRPWHFAEVMHLCTELSPYSCERYSAVTAGTMQGILAQRAKAEKAVRGEREGAIRLKRRITGAAIKMQRTGRPLSEEQMAQMRLLLQQVSAGAGIAQWQLRRLQQAAGTTFQDKEYVRHVDALLPLLEEARRVTDAARRQMLPEVEALQDELLGFQADMDDRRLSRDQVLDFLGALRDRPLAAALADGWPPVTPDEAVPWRYPPRSYWRPKPSRWWEAGDGSAEGGGGAGAGAGAGAGKELVGERSEGLALTVGSRARAAGDGEVTRAGGGASGSRGVRGGRMSSAGEGSRGGQRRSDEDDDMMFLMLSSFGGGTEGMGGWGAMDGGEGAEQYEELFGAVSEAPEAPLAPSTPLPGMFD